jgi:uncharacterized membrane protein YtjA (UPF0391 family)
MLSWAVVFLVVAIIAGLLGFTGIAGTAANIAWILFVIGARVYAGAVLQTDEGDTVYVAGLAAWPGDLVGRRVEVTGKLARKKLIPDPEVNEDGEHTAGAYGLQDVLEGARWKLSRK